MDIKTENTTCPSTAAGNDRPPWKRIVFDEPPRSRTINGASSKTKYSHNVRTQNGFRVPPSSITRVVQQAEGTERAGVLTTCVRNSRRFRRRNSAGGRVGLLFTQNVRNHSRVYVLAGPRFFRYTIVARATAEGGGEWCRKSKRRARGVKIRILSNGPFVCPRGQGSQNNSRTGRRRNGRSRP